MNERIRSAVDDFLTYCEVERNLSSATIGSYRASLRCFLQFLGRLKGEGGEEITLEEVRRAHIRRYMGYLKNERNNGPGAINVKLNAVRGLFRFLVESDDWPISDDPTHGIRRLRRAKTLPVYLTLEEAGLLLSSVRRTSEHPERDYAIFLVFLQCGCRFSELLNLKVDSIDFETSTLRVYGKGRKERIVPLTDRTIKALKGYLQVRRPGVPTDILFLNNHGSPLSVTRFRVLFRQLVNDSPLNKPNLTPHKLRHTCLTLLLQAGVDIRTLQEIAGHADLSSTQIYTHVPQERIFGAMTKHPLG